MKHLSIKWISKDVALLILLALAILSLVSFFGKGLDAVISSMDRPNPNRTYEDFQVYYYPAALAIYKNPKPLGGYFYTPSFALLLHYLVACQPEQALIRWQIFQYIWLLLLLIIPAFYLAEIAQKKSFAFYYLAACLTSVPLYHNLKWGQVSVMITFCSIFALILYEKRKLKTAAFFLAAATTVKYYPGFLIAGFLFKKDWKFISYFTGFLFLLGFLIPGALLGFTVTLDFYQLSLAEMNYAIDWVAGDINSQYFAHVMIRILGTSPDTKGMISLLGMLICLFALWKMYLPYRNNVKSNSDIQIFSIVFLLMPLLINTSWPHYFAWLPFCGILALIKSKALLERSLVGLALLLQSFVVFSLFSDYRGYAFSGILLLANFIILRALLKKGDDLYA